jgi:hypothetical protein
MGVWKAPLASVWAPNSGLAYLAVLAVPGIGSGYSRSMPTAAAGADGSKARRHRSPDTLALVVFDTERAIGACRERYPSHVAPMFPVTPNVSSGERCKGIMP